MGRLILLVGLTIVILGTLITFEVPMDWIGTLPGDFSLHWKGMMVFVPVTSSLVFSLALAVFLFIFTKN